MRTTRKVQAALKRAVGAKAVAQQGRSGAGSEEEESAQVVMIQSHFARLADGNPLVVCKTVLDQVGSVPFREVGGRESVVCKTVLDQVGPFREVGGIRWWYARRCWIRKEMTNMNHDLES